MINDIDSSTNARDSSESEHFQTTITFTTNLEDMEKTENDIEVSVHRTSGFFKKEIGIVFPFLDLKKEELLAIPTFQRARYDLVGIGDHIEAEKDRLLETFFVFAKKLCDALQSKGYWCDYIDPCSGLPMISQDCNKVYAEVNGAQMLLKYQVQNAGCCKILLHPRFGSAVYPASIFTTATYQHTVDIISEIARSST